jgi:T4 RnlA family RNA ligase
MNERQKTLYNNLINLTELSDTFYYIDKEIDGNIIRIFNYRLIANNEIMLPDSLECRGHSFLLVNGEPVSMVSFPFEKFFNINENPYTQNLDFSSNNVELILEKLDGSMIQTCNIRGKVYLKTKASFDSEQAIEATKLFNSESHKKLKEIVTRWTLVNYTVVMEYVSPTNKIVLKYPEPRLVVLGIRNNVDGTILAWDLIQHIFRNCDAKHLAIDHTEEFKFTMDKFLHDAPQYTGIEGYVITLKDGQRIKLKTKEYFLLHSVADILTSDKKLFLSVVNAESDDLKSALFEDNDTFGFQRVVDMEKMVHDKLNTIIHFTKMFAENNKALYRKDFAIKGLSQMGNIYFKIAINYYSGYETDFTQWLIRHVDTLISTDLYMVLHDTTIVKMFVTWDEATDFVDNFDNVDKENLLIENMVDSYNLL